MGPWNCLLDIQATHPFSLSGRSSFHLVRTAPWIISAALGVFQVEFQKVPGRLKMHLYQRLSAAGGPSSRSCSQHLAFLPVQGQLLFQVTALGKRQRRWPVKWAPRPHASPAPCSPLPSSIRTFWGRGPNLSASEGLLASTLGRISRSYP